MIFPKLYTAKLIFNRHKKTTSYICILHHKNTKAFFQRGQTERRCAKSLLSFIFLSINISIDV